MQTKVRSWKLEVGRSIFVLFSIFFSLTSQAQCAMCRAALESEGNTIKAEAVNDGIVYLMAIPYLLVAFVGYAVYRVFKNKKNPNSENSN